MGTFEGESCWTEANFDWDGMVLRLLTFFGDGVEDDDESVDGDEDGLFDGGGDGDGRDDGTGDSGDDGGFGC
jgi:hypothetical protein